GNSLRDFSPDTRTISKWRLKPRRRACTSTSVPPCCIKGYSSARAILVKAGIVVPDGNSSLSQLSNKHEPLPLVPQPLNEGAREGFPLTLPPNWQRDVARTRRRGRLRYVAQPSRLRVPGA